MAGDLKLGLCVAGCGGTGPRQFRGGHSLSPIGWHAARQSVSWRLGLRRSPAMRPATVQEALMRYCSTKSRSRIPAALSQRAASCCCALTAFEPLLACAALAAMAGGSASVGAVPLPVPLLGAGQEPDGGEGSHRSACVWSGPGTSDGSRRMSERAPGVQGRSAEGQKIRSGVGTWTDCHQRGVLWTETEALGVPEVLSVRAPRSSVFCDRAREYKRALCAPQRACVRACVVRARES